LRAAQFACAGLAQLVEHLICNQGVAGSNPATGTNPRAHAQTLWRTTAAQTMAPIMPPAKALA
jgi:hypothetical protein